jgi:superfamily II DNA helicase RecQ
MEFCWYARPPATSTSTSTSTSTAEVNRTQPLSGTITLDNLQEQFCYLERYRVLVCREHATGIQNINVHLRDQHAVASKERKAIVEYCRRWQIAAPRNVKLPPPLGPPIKELGEPLDAYYCQIASDCSFCTVNKNRLQKHCNKEHRKAWDSKTTPYKKVKVQTFFPTGGLQRYFTVNAANSNSEPSIPREVEEVVRRRLVEWKATKQIHDKRAQIMDAEAAKTDKTGWFKRTGWLEHLANRNLVHLAHQVRLPDRDEVNLQVAAKRVEQLMERSVKGLSTLARETRRWLKSAKQFEVDQRPIGRLQNPESQARYASYMVKFVCYFLRVIVDEARIEAQPHRNTDSDGISDGNGDSDGDSDSNSIFTVSSADRASVGYRSRSGSPGSDTNSNSRPRRPERKKKETDLMKDARELFCWTVRQKLLALRLWESLEGDDEEEQLSALLDVLASFILVSVGDQPFRSGLVHFLAVLGIDAETDRLRTAKNYTYMLAGVVYCMRLLSVEKLLPAAQRDEQTDEDRERFLQMRRQHLADGSYSPMSEVLSLLAYGKFVAMTAGNSGNAYWSEDKKIFYLNGRPIYISQFRKMAQDMVAEVESMLWQELFWIDRVADRFAVPLKRLVDDVTFTRRGESFVHQSSNGLEGGLEWMLTQAEQNEEGLKLQSRDGKWEVRQVKKYLRQVERFLGLLMVCVHMTSGQPGRGSEVTTMRHRNGVLQDRNIFVMDGQVMTVVRYHKSQSQWDKPKVIPRFLPQRLGQVMVVYLAYLQPFQEYLTVEVLGGGFSDYVWADQQGPWGTDRLTRALKRETGKRLGVELHTLDYRHTAVGIGRVVVGESFSKGYQDDVGETEEAEVDEEGEDLVELQSARTTVMGVGNYSVPIDIVKHLSVRSIEAFRPLSTMWHRFLGLEGERVQEEAWGSIERGGSRKRQERSGEEGDVAEVEVGQYRGLAVRRRGSNGKEAAIRRGMQQVLGQEDVGFRSVEQEQALEAVLDGQTPLVVVLPTGGGKSLLFSVPACLDDSGVTVVVVPYRALIEDLVGRIQKCGINCMEWKHGESNPATIVVVSADVAGDITSNGNFISYAVMLNGKGLLRRVVVDECHLIFTSSDWRPKLARLKNLRLLSCPIVLLTATLPPVREGELCESMLIQVATYIRASTVRPNTRYTVSWCKQGKAQEAALATCQRQRQRMKERRVKGVVYCHSKAQCEEMAEELDCGYYHAGVVDRAEPLAEWLKEGGWIVATSALGTGVDFPGIVFILHVGMPWSMIDFAQESGRGGRAGERVDSVIVVEEGEVERTIARKGEDLDVQAMGMFLTGSGCRRGLMSGYLDGKQVSCNDVESAGCDRCGEGIREWQDSQVEASSGWQQVQELMDDIRAGCAVCCIAGEAGTEEWKKHKVLQCTAYPGMTGMEVDRFRQGIRDGGGTHSCRRCWVSQKYCATGEDVGNRCQWPNVVVPVARAAAEDEAGIDIIRQCGYKGELGGEWKEYAGWLGKRHNQRVWGEFFSNVMVVAIRVLLFCKEYGIE